MSISVYIKTFIILIMIYVLALFISFSIPFSGVDDHSLDAQKVIQRDGVYPHVNKDIPVTQLDNFTDLQVMIPRVSIKNNPLYHSMDMNDYARYWHGYATFLRPALSIFSLTEIRIIYGIAIVMLVCATYSAINKSIGCAAAVSFGISMAMIHVEIFGQSMQYSNIFIITMLFMLFLYKKSELISTNTNKIPLYFFIIGSVVNYVDLLTVPVISLSLPMIMVIFYVNKNPVSIKESCLIVVKSSFSWALGYGLTWCAKWAVASVVLMKNVPKEAINQIFFRVMGDNEFPTDRIYTLLVNFEGIFVNRWISILLVLVFLLSFILHRYLRPSISVPLFIVSMMPYVWYVFLANHSQIHAFFVFRAQVGTMMSSIILLSMIIDSLKQILHKK
ncbi:hypothetical protein EVJ15_05020 [Salmonella enterica subsp. enterica serovar Urbana]|nr:hypothetical protein [Salmonella enterica subsp. enterica serovar Urbana]